MDPNTLKTTDARELKTYRAVKSLLRQHKENLPVDEEL